MAHVSRPLRRRENLILLPLAALVVAFVVDPAFAQSPWTKSVTNLSEFFTGTAAKALSLVAIVIGGLVFAFGEGQGKKVIAGIIFGCGMAIGAASFLSWLF